MKKISLSWFFIILCAVVGGGVILLNLYFKIIRFKTTPIINSSESLIVENNNFLIASPAENSAPAENLFLPTPQKVKAIYMTGYSFTHSDLRQNLIDLVETSELNSLVIYVKDPNNKFIFYPQSEILKNQPISPTAISNQDVKNILKDLQDKDIYTIARIVTFQDNTIAEVLPQYALKAKNGRLWRDYGGHAWLDMTNPQVWQLPVNQAKEAFDLGFDEVQFDYIRFPSDGNINNIDYHQLSDNRKRYQVLNEFFKYLKTELSSYKQPISLDLFGLTYKNWADPEYDLGIGQRLIDALPYFDYISPMVYPSHYPNGYLGYSNPAAHPYEIVNDSLIEGNQIVQNSNLANPASTRPWLQDFDMGANYTAKMIDAQIKACDENNTNGWILWNPRNQYTVEASEIKNKIQLSEK